MARQKWRNSQEFREPPRAMQIPANFTRSDRPGSCSASVTLDLSLGTVLFAAVSPIKESTSTWITTSSDSLRRRIQYIHKCLQSFGRGKRAGTGCGTFFLKLAACVALKQRDS